LVARRRRAITVIAVGTRSTTYQCLNCSLARRAEVRSSRRSRPTLSEANSSMAMLLAIKRCPRCGHYDRGVAGHNKRTLVVTEVLVACIVATVALCLWLIPMPRLAVAIGTAVTAIGFVVQLVLLMHRYPRDSETRVTLSEPLPVDNRWWVG